jgi:hypothetical protein
MIFKLEGFSMEIQASGESPVIFSRRAKGRSEIKLKRHPYRPVLAIFSLLFILGCAFLSPRPFPPYPESVEECQAFFDQLEEKVREAGVRDASGFLIQDFPYLRTNRFLSAMMNRSRDAGEKEKWVQRMRGLDLQARENEISNLPDKSIRSLPFTEAMHPDRKEVYRRVESCSNKLLNRYKALEDFNATLSSRIAVPDEYLFWRRAIGLYPLMAVPVAIASHNALVKTRAWFEIDPQNLPVAGRIRAYVPAENLSLGEETIQALMDDSTKNPLGVPLPDEDRGKTLAWSFCPVILQDVAGPRDRIGKVAWKGDHPWTDTERPTVYYYFSHAFWKGLPILQINYVIWYPKRAGKESPWIERGLMDGLTLRVSLDLQGKPFMVDVMNNCGCYHFFAPAKDRVAGIISKNFKPDPFVPQWLPEVPLGNHLGIRVTSDWHRAVRLLSVGATSDSIPYELIPYVSLKALPHENGRKESIFDGRGIVKGSERPERFFLFSMGIPDIGSMREQGHHAIELIGRPHFDDPYLFDRNFVFQEEK